MDEKLEKYRTKVQRKAFFDKVKQRLLNMIPFSPENRNEKKNEETILISDRLLEKEKLIESENEDTLSYVSSDDEGNVQENRNENQNEEGTKMKYFVGILWFIFWATCWMIAIELGFGIVFLLFSALFGIYFNTRTGPKLKGEISAYSVFNKDCENIKGTLTAEQLQREMIYGPFAAMR